jgi:uracil-DNA glycosylase family 4
MDKAAALAEIAERIKTDNVCPELRDGATQLVFADGNPDSDVVFIGEAPGANEDKQGIPFVGAAGKFFNEMLEGIGLKRSDIYITNIVKYRPPNNRDPLPEEIEAFMPYLKEQLAVIEPALIVFLGRHAMSVFMPELKISQVHGQPKRKNGQVYLPLFHPAAALYNGGMRATVIEDFNKIPKIIELVKGEKVNHGA